MNKFDDRRRPRYEPSFEPDPESIQKTQQFDSFSDGCWDYLPFDTAFNDPYDVLDVITITFPKTRRFHHPF